MILQSLKMVYKDIMGMIKAMLKKENLKKNMHYDCKVEK